MIISLPLTDSARFDCCVIVRLPDAPPAWGARTPRHRRLLRLPNDPRRSVHSLPKLGALRVPMPCEAIPRRVQPPVTTPLSASRHTRGRPAQPLLEFS